MTERNKVIVYSTATCPWCDRTKEYLQSRNVPFVEKRVDSDMDAAREMVEISGQQGVPVVSTDREVIVGFDQLRLARIADRFSGPKRPAFGVLGANAEDFFARHPEKRPGDDLDIKGVYVGQVKPRSVAERAGVQVGDVIQAMANKRVRNMYAMDQLMESVKSGDMVSVRVLRGNEDVNLTMDFAMPGQAPHA
jgi:glutaredoxin-like YruB-family protein